MSLEMKAVVLNKLQQLTGNQNYGKTCYNDVYDKTNGESVRRLKCWNYNGYSQRSINASNFKQFQNEIGALSNDQYRVELDRLKGSDMYDYIVIRIITLVVEAPKVDTTPVINVFTPANMYKMVMAYFSKDIKTNLITY